MNVAILVDEAARQVALRHGRIINIDASLIAQQPKLAPHIDAMKANLADALGLAPKRIGLKATTNEQLGFIGREEGIAGKPMPPGKALTPEEIQVLETWISGLK